MSNDIENLHHIGLLTRDFTATVARYEQLGFSFTPLSVPQVPLSAGGPPESLGVANRCAIFTNNYLEILGIIDATRWATITRAQRGPYDIDPALARYEGLHVLHLASSDLERTRDRSLGIGLQPSAIRPFQRMVETLEGERLMRARSLAFPPGSDPEALVQIAQHQTPELVLQPRFMTHSNGATSVSEVILCVTDPDRVAEKYAGYTGHPPQRERIATVIELGQARLKIIRPEDLTVMLPGETVPAVPYLAAFTVRGENRRAAEVLRSEGISYEEFAAVSWFALETPAVWRYYSKMRMNDHKAVVTETATRETRSRLNPEIRRKQIVDVAFDAVAARGFEGLRTRDVAALAGINSATLHHHFPTKEDLIAGIAAELAARFRAERGSSGNKVPERSAAAALADQFTDVAYYHHDRPQMLAVYRELVSRTSRDSLTAALVKKLDDEWRSDLMDIFRRARKDGSLRGDLDPIAAADLVLSTIQGLVTAADISIAKIKRSLQALEKCLTSVHDTG